MLDKLDELRALAEGWNDAHDAMSCPLYDCSDCTLVNAAQDVFNILDA